MPIASSIPQQILMHSSKLPTLQKTQKWFSFVSIYDIETISVKTWRL